MVFALSKSKVAKSPGSGRVDRLDFLGATYLSNGGSQGIFPWQLGRARTTICEMVGDCWLPINSAMERQKIVYSQA